MALDGEKALAQLLLAVGIGIGRELVVGLVELLFGRAQLVFFLADFGLELGPVGLELFLDAFCGEGFIENALNIDDENGVARGRGSRCGKRRGSLKASQR